MVTKIVMETGAQTTPSSHPPCFQRFGTHDVAEYSCAFQIIYIRSLNLSNPECYISSSCNFCDGILGVKAGKKVAMRKGCRHPIAPAQPPPLLLLLPFFFVLVSRCGCPILKFESCNRIYTRVLFKLNTAPESAGVMTLLKRCVFQSLLDRALALNLTLTLTQTLALTITRTQTPNPNQP